VSLPADGFAMSDSASPSFNYFVSSKGIFMVISLIGPVNDRAVPVLQSLHSEIRDNSEASLFIFNFRDMLELSGDAVCLLAQIQKDIRCKPSEVRLCGLRPKLKNKLLSRGIIRTSEIFDNLQVAIQCPPRPLQKKSA